jgi:hypothetical protein
LSEIHKVAARRLLHRQITHNTLEVALLVDTPRQPQRRQGHKAIINIGVPRGTPIFVMVAAAIGEYQKKLPDAKRQAALF